MPAVSWQTLELQEPGLAEFGRDRLDGKVAYLATVRKGGFPRASAVSPIISDGGCYLFVEPSSSKNADLTSSGQFGLHCAISDTSGSSGEFQISGEVARIDDPLIRDGVLLGSSYKPASRTVLYELRISEVIAISWRGGRAVRRKWTPAED